LPSATFLEDTFGPGYSDYVYLSDEVASAVITCFSACNNDGNVGGVTLFHNDNPVLAFHLGESPFAESQIVRIGLSPGDLLQCYAGAEGTTINVTASYTLAS
jgi:hypothetical protein